MLPSILEGIPESLPPTRMLEHIPTDPATPVLVKRIEHKERGRERLRLFAHDMWSKVNKLIDEHVAAARKARETDGIMKDLAHTCQSEVPLSLQKRPSWCSSTPWSRK
jgi:hypothetical protein